MKKKITASLLWAVLLMGFISPNLFASKAPTYKVDDKFNPTLESNVVYMATMPHDKICCLLKRGVVLILNSKAKELKRFEAKGEGVATTIAVDKKGEIIVLFTAYKMKEFKHKGRTYKRNVPVSVSFSIYNKNGKQLGTKEITKGARSATAAQILRDTLVIADNQTRSLHFVSMKSGKIKKSVGKFRLCCGIFDFCKGPKNTLMVANLGAFKVQTIKSNGGFGKSFGKRGKKLEDLHGCCNPVSVASLPDGAVVTVEKDTTRVKVFDKKCKKAKLIEGIQELVKGCRHIPLAVDSKGNIYLASNKKKIIKCVRK